MKKIIVAAVTALSLGLSVPALAQTGHSSGEVRKINKDAGKITIKHGPIEGMDMPGMTMVFRAKDPSLLDKVKVGDKIDFTVTQEQGAMVILSAEPKR